jgi:hypothetical protein
MSVLPTMPRFVRQLMRAFDAQVAAMPGIGGLFTSKWNIIHGDFSDGFALVTEEGVQEIPHRISPKELKGRNCLRLGARIGQIRHLHLPAAAANDPAAAVALNLDSLSPIPAEDTLFALQSVTSSDAAEQINVEVALASRSKVQQLLTQAKQHGLSFAAVDVIEADHLLRDPKIDLLSGEAARAGVSPTRVWMLICAALLLAAAGLHGWANWQLEPQETALRAESRPIGFAIAREQKQARSARLSISQTWAAVTTALPDTAWAEHMTVDGQELRLAGHAENAAALVSQLEESPAFSGVRLAAASVQEEEGRESFDLLATISAGDAP